MKDEDVLLDKVVKKTNVNKGEILKLLYAWYTVREYKVWNNVELFVSNDEDELEKKSAWLSDNDIEHDWKNITSELNAIRFNSEAMKLQVITNNIIPNG